MEITPTRRLTLQLVCETLQLNAESLDEEQMQTLFELKTLRLDMFGLEKLENVNVYTNVRELYLQANRIKRIEGLECMKLLVLLALRGNLIEKIENIDHLTKLQCLDLRENAINDFELNELPNALRIIYFHGNPFLRHMPQYAALFFARLPTLKQIDSYHKSNEGEITQIEDCSAQMYDMPDTEHNERKAVLDWEATEKVCSIQCEAVTKAISAHRTAAIESAQKATECAIADSKTHFKELEAEHYTWRQRLQH